MDFSFNKTITKELLLQHYSQETYLEYYLGIPVKKGLFISPLRVDKTPTCSFYKSKNGDIIFKDFNGSFSGNFINIVMFLKNCNYYQALKYIAQDFNIIKGNSKVNSFIKVSNTKFEDKGPSKIQITKQDFTKLELEWWGKYNISLEILNKFQVYSCKNVFLNDVFCAKSDKNNMIFGYYGNKRNKMELWRCYFPQRKQYRFLTNWPASKIQGFKQLPKSGKLLVITKSMKDVMSLYSFGITAIAPNSENLFLDKEVLDNLKSRFKTIIVFYDQDKAGKFNMAKIRKKYPELKYFVIPKEYQAKDFSDLVVAYGKEKVKKYIQEVKAFFNVVGK